jgi:hypothetical protein
MWGRSLFCAMRDALGFFENKFMMMRTSFSEANNKDLSDL